MKNNRAVYQVLSIERQDNQYNKYLKWVLKTRLRGITEQEDATNFLPLEERQIYNEWFKSKPQAEEKATFYRKNYSCDGWHTLNEIPFFELTKP